MKIIMHFLLLELLVFKTYEYENLGLFLFEIIVCQIMLKFIYV
jgi:hypothetical protein